MTSIRNNSSIPESGSIEVAATKIVVDVSGLLQRAAADRQLIRGAGLLLAVVLTIALLCSFVLGLLVFACFGAGLSLAAVLLHRREDVAKFCSERWSLEALVANVLRSAELDATTLPPNQPQYAAEVLAREPWKGLHIDSDLDRAVDSFFSRILGTFIDSWYAPLTADEHFTRAVRQHLREALSRIVHLVQRVNIPRLATDRLLPLCFAHYEVVQRLHGENLTKTTPPSHPNLAYAYRAIHQHSVHPALHDRRTERAYLRRLAAFLVPRLCPNAMRQQSLDSAVVDSLLRELFGQWALLPLMDVLSDPDLINLLVLEATNRSGKVLAGPSADGRVEFLARFVRRSPEIHQPQQQQQQYHHHHHHHRHQHHQRRSKRRNGNGNGASDLLTDQTQLYSFMQYLKREGAVDVLRFYLDVVALNADLLDPKVTTDPMKLSALQQQSERLLGTYRAMQRAECDAAEVDELVVRTLAEAHELVRAELLGRWQSGFRATTEYYRVVYGDRELHDAEEAREPDASGGFRLGSKLKEALRSAIDGAPLEACESGWEPYGDDSLPLHSIANNAPASLKLRKERGHRMDQFIASFMQSIECVPDVGVDAAAASKTSAHVAVRKRTPPGRNPTFANLFDDATAVSNNRRIVPSTSPKDDRHAGASGCLIFILVRIFNVPVLVVRFVLAIIAVARSHIDRAVWLLIERLLRIGVHEPRLTMLVTTLENHLFGARKHTHEPAGATELAERRRQARQRLGRIHSDLPLVLDVLQTPALNKQLMYTLLDVVLVELWPELAPTSGQDVDGLR